MAVLSRRDVLVICSASMNLRTRAYVRRRPWSPSERRSNILFMATFWRWLSQNPGFGASSVLSGPAALSLLPPSVLPSHIPASPDPVTKHTRGIFSFLTPHTVSHYVAADSLPFLSWQRLLLSLHPSSASFFESRFTNHLNLWIPFNPYWHFSFFWPLSISPMLFFLWNKHALSTY